MIYYSFTKAANLDKLQTELSGISGYLHSELIGATDLRCYFSNELSTEDQATLSSLISSHVAADPQAQVENIIQLAMTFGAKLLREFAAQNVLLGITQEGKTGEVLTKLMNVQLAVQAGSLYEAIDRIRAIPPTDYDGKYITEARLLTFINKIEAYLGLPLSTEL